MTTKLLNTQCVPTWSEVQETANSVAMEFFLDYLFARLHSSELTLYVPQSIGSVGLLRVLIDGVMCVPFAVMDARGHMIASVILEEGEATTFIAYVRREC